MPGAATCIANFFKWKFSAEVAADKVMKRYGEKCVQYAQTNRRWTDRTRHAKEEISTETEHGAEKIETFVFHAMQLAPYSYYLETRIFSIKGFLGILDEAIVHDMPGLYADLRRIFAFGDLKGYEIDIKFTGAFAPT